MVADRRPHRGDTPVSDGDEGGLKFHYNRERRLERAPEAVRRAYEEGWTPNRGFIKGLTANTGLRSIFFVIIIMCVSIFGLSILGNSSNSGTVEGVPVRLKAFLYEETVYITVSFQEKEIAAPVPVTAVIQGLDPDGVAVFRTETGGTYGGKELLLRTTMKDYEIKTVTASVKFDKSEAILSVTVDRT